MAQLIEQPPHGPSPKHAALLEVDKESELHHETVPIRRDLDELRSLIPALAHLRDQYLSSNRRANKAEYDGKMATAQQVVARATRAIQKVELQTREGLKAGKFTRPEAQQRMAVSAHLTASMLELTQQLWEDDSRFNERVQGQVARRVRIRFTDKNGVHRTEAECDEIAQKLIQQKQQGYLFMQARVELEDALAQHEALVELRDQVLELHKLVNYLHRLIAWQSDQLKYIEGNVDTAGQALQNGVDDLTDARKCELKAMLPGQGTADKRKKSGKGIFTKSSSW